MAAEVFSKSAVVVLASFSRSFKPGLGELFIRESRRQRPYVLPALFLAGVFNPIAALTSWVAAVTLYLAAYRHLGGANGDMLGAAM